MESACGIAVEYEIRQAGVPSELLSEKVAPASRPSAIDFALSFRIKREARMNPARGVSMVEDRPVVEHQPAALQEAETGNVGGGGEIRCPLCAWRPGQKDLWICRCNHAWNTFDTGGVCPNCLYQWEYTQCFACHGWSLHSDWYPKN
jgi:hypothetical protein